MSNRPFGLFFLDESLLRLSPSANERLVRDDAFQKQAGGAEMNMAVGASLLGLHTGVITKLPANDMGSFIKNKTHPYGISDDYFVYDNSQNARLGLYYHEYGAYPRKSKAIYDRKNSSFYSISRQEFPEEMYKATTCFHATGITLALCPETRKTATDMMKWFKMPGTIISFNINFCGNLRTGDETEACTRGILPFVDVFFCSEDTAGLTFHKTGTVKEMMKSFAGEYPIFVLAFTQRVVRSPKFHTFGSIVYDAARDEYYGEEPYRNIEVIDRIGSGDAHIAGVLYGLLSGGGDCMKVAQYGNVASAVKNAISGDLPTPDLEEINTIIKEHNQKGP